MNICVQKKGDVVVLGDGIAGRAIARSIAERGHSVDIVTATRRPATRAAAGMLSPLPESVPGSAFQLTCLAARDNWLTYAELLRQETGIDLGLCTKPSLFPAFTEAEVESVESLRQRAIAAGEGAETLDGQQVYEFVPTLRQGAQQGLLLTDEARIDPIKVLEALEHSLEVHGVLIHENRAVREVRAQGDRVELLGHDWRLECEHVVVAAGAWSAQIKGLGLEELVRPVRGEMLSFKADGSWHGCIRHGDHYALTRGEEIHFGATLDEAGFDDITTDAGAKALRDAAEALLPKLTWRRTLRHWSGLRPGSIDSLPIVGPWQNDRILMATGAFRNGILLAPWMADVIGDLVDSGSSSHLPAELSTSRFAGAGPASSI